MSLLNSGNSKTRKGEKKGVTTYGIHLAPASLSGFNVCDSSSAGCRWACLNTAGRGAMTSVQRARIKKTLFFFKDKQGFLAELWAEVAKSIKSAARKNMTPCFRLNLTSDLPWEKIKFNGQSVMEAFPNVQFYDYCKSPERMTKFVNGEMPKNYHLTFSRSETTPAALVESVLKSKGNVAIVFRKTLPKKWKGFKVVNGDESDVRFKDPKGVIVGLVEKGMAKKDLTGFVLEPN